MSVCGRILNSIKSQEDGITRVIEKERFKVEYTMETDWSETTSDITSEHLNEVPSSLFSTWPGGKKCTGECVRKQHKLATIYLLDADLWKRFMDLGTEMIITKKGRRVFPVPSYIICDLDPNKLYNVTLQIQSVDNAVHKYVSSEWITCKEGTQFYPTPVPGRNTYLHPYSPNTGAHWMREPISFSGLKISNNLEALGTIVLQSMRKYQMVLMISELNGTMEVQFPQPETQFVAVTQYQNEQVTQMKIEHNPFANAFRFTSTKKDKNKSQISIEDDNESISNDLSPERSPKTHVTSTPNPDRGMSIMSQIQSQDRFQKSNALTPLKDSTKHTLPIQSNSHSSSDPGVSRWSSYNGANPTYVPYSEQMDLSKTLPMSNYMYSPVGANPLALVRHLGQRQLGADVAPLALIKKRKNPEEIISESKPNNKPSSSGKRRATSSINDGRNTVGLLRTSEKKVLTHLDYMKMYGMYGLPMPHSMEAFNTWQESATDLSKKSLDPTSATGGAANDRPSMNCIKPEITLKNRDLWETTHEVVISAEGRLMFPYIALSIKNVEPKRNYFISLELTPASNWLHDYVDHEWTPTLETSNEFRVSPYQHPENPQIGQEWESGIVFDRLRLSTTRQGKNLLKVQLRRQYYPTIVVRTGLQTWQYCLKDAMFITVCIDRSQMVQKKPQDGVSENTLCLLGSDVLMRSSQRKQTNPKKMCHESTHTETESRSVDLSCPESLQPPKEMPTDKSFNNSDEVLQISNVTSLADLTAPTTGMALTAHDHGMLDSEASNLLFRKWHVPYCSSQPNEETLIHSAQHSKAQDLSILCNSSPKKPTDFRIFQLSNFYSASVLNGHTNAASADESPANLSFGKGISSNTLNESISSSSSGSVIEDTSFDGFKKENKYINAFIFKEDIEDNDHKSQFLCSNESSLCLQGVHSVSDSDSKLR